MLRALLVEKLKVNFVAWIVMGHIGGANHAL
jgi:hypothetical protein